MLQKECLVIQHKLVKLDADGKVANKTAKKQPDFRNINSYAVNGAVHYANALLHYTSYTDIIAIGMTGYKNDAGKLEYEIGVYYVSKSNFGVGQKVDDFTDLSLPVNEAGNPDYDKMAIIISAIHKLVIKDVVAYSNRKIKATKAVVK